MKIQIPKLNFTGSIPVGCANHINDLDAAYKSGSRFASTLCVPVCVPKRVPTPKKYPESGGNFLIRFRISSRITRLPGSKPCCIKLSLQTSDLALASARLAKLFSALTSVKTVKAPSMDSYNQVIREMPGIT